LDLRSIHRTYETTAKIWVGLMTDRALGVVVVGTGHGCRIHVPAFRNAGFDVLALVGTDRDRVERRAGRAGVVAACTSLDEALRIPGADVVVISTPPASHAELAEQALEAGRHVLLEKPFTTNADEGRRLVAAAERSGVTAIVGHEFRFASERVTFAAAVRNGLIGPPRLATFVNQIAFVQSIRMPAWWYDPAQGGGWLMAGVSHTVDAIRSALGDFVDVSAAMPLVADVDPASVADDSVCVRFRLASGCEGVLQESAAAFGDPVSIVRVVGPQGSLQLKAQSVIHGDAEGSRELPQVSSPRLAEVRETESSSPFANIELPAATVQASIFRDLVAGVAPTLEEGLPATFADGLACMQVIDAVRRSSSEAGAVVRVEDC
jgi:predicted dehydrogenase